MRILFYIFILIPIIALGQKNNTKDIKPHPLDMRKSKASFHAIHLGSSDIKDVENYLKNNIDNLKNSPYTFLKLLHKIESPGGIHLTYIQLYNSTPIYGTQVKVNLNKGGIINSIFDNSILITEALSDNFPSRSVAGIYLNNIHRLKSNNIENIYFFHEGQLIPAVKLEITEGDHNYYEVIIDNEGKVFYKKDLNRYFRPLIQDSIVSASVFMPDPLTTAGVSYGSPYVDLSDSDVSELNAEIVNVNITVDFTNDTFRLISPYVKISELSNPVTAETYSISPSFNYTRSQQAFEDINAYYHIYVYQEYMQSLGFTNLVDYQIGVDAHALNGDDQSIFSSGSLLFGEGGVDDAEDADVIIHEYAHAILTSASPGTWSGFERQSLEEGLGDYLATSYSRDINPFNWQNMFSWDGHNPFWNGRNTASTKHYPEDLGFDMHLASEIWSSALMQIWGDIGRTTTDQILLQSLYSYAAGMTMVDAALLFIQADSVLNGGANYIQSYNRFVERGFFIDTTLAINDPDMNGKKNIQIVNTEGFSNGSGDALIKFYKPTSATIKLMDIRGRIVYNKEVFNITQLPINGNLFSEGVYILNVQTAFEAVHLKLVKAN